MVSLSRWVLRSTVLAAFPGQAALAQAQLPGIDARLWWVVYAVICVVLAIGASVAAGRARRSLDVDRESSRPATIRVLAGALWIAVTGALTLALATLLVFAAGSFLGAAPWTLVASFQIVGGATLGILLAAATVYAAAEAHYALPDRSRGPGPDYAGPIPDPSTLLASALVLVAVVGAAALVALLVAAAGLAEGSSRFVTGETVRTVIVVLALAVGTAVSGWLLVHSLFHGGSLSIESNWGGFGGGLGGWRVSPSVAYLVVTLMFGGALVGVAIDRDGGARGTPSGSSAGASPKSPSSPAAMTAAESAAPAHAASGAAAKPGGSR